MELMSELNTSDLKESTGKTDVSFDADIQEKYDVLLEDDKISNRDTEKNAALSSDKINDKYNNLFEESDLSKTENTPKTKSTPETADTPRASANADVSAASSETESDENTKTEKDSNDNEYMRNGELIPNNEYTVNGNNTYKTDGKCRIISYDSKPKYTVGGSRDLTEQKEVGGSERRDDDDGGHLIARIFGGSVGKENLVPMRITINRGDYKKMENEIASACKENKDVFLHGEIKYNGDSQRPSIISAEYKIDDKKTAVWFDNKENSAELLDTLKDKISEQDCKNLCDEMEDMQADGCDASITSVKTEYDLNGKETKVTVGVLNESTAEKTYKVYYPANKEA